MSTATLPAVVNGHQAHPDNVPAVRVADIQVMAKQIAASRLFGMDESQAFTLMLLAHSKGMHPIQAVERYHVIQGKPAMKADAMLAEFQSRGGRVEWGQHDHARCEATFEAPGVKTPTVVSWTLEDARKAELLKNPMWSKYSRQMLRARVISEGIRMTMPGILSGIYTPEEVADFAQDAPAYRDRDQDPEPAEDRVRPHHAVNHQNDTGHGSGAYASPEVLADLRLWAKEFLGPWEEKWADLVQRYEGAEDDPRFKAFMSPWQLTGHLFKHARERGLMNAPDDARQNQRLGFLGVAWERSRPEVIAEAEAYAEAVWAEKRALLDPDPADESQDADPDGDIYPAEPGMGG